MHQRVRFRPYPRLVPYLLIAGGGYLFLKYLGAPSIDGGGRADFHASGWPV